jgi:hypothetical protein
MLKSFQSFLARMKASFTRISRSTRNEMAVEDLHNDAFVLALEIGDRRGRPIDFSDPADAELVMGALYVENVRRGDWKMRRAVRIDQEPEEEGSTWADRLPARASSDPLIFLLAREAAIDVEALVTDSYSQASAYVITLWNFNQNRQKICAYLALSEAGFFRRLSSAADTIRVQSSMFDRLERIPADFFPLAGRQYAPQVEDKRDAKQWAWTFGMGE